MMVAQEMVAQFLRCMNVVLFEKGCHSEGAAHRIQYPIAGYAQHPLVVHANCALVCCEPRMTIEWELNGEHVHHTPNKVELLCNSDDSQVLSVLIQERAVVAIPSVLLGY